MRMETLSLSKRPGEAYCITPDTEAPDSLYVDHLYEVETDGEYLIEGRHFNGAGGATYTGFTVTELIEYLEED